MKINLTFLITQAERQGWKVVQSTHIKFYPSNKAYPMIVVSRTPSDRKAAFNILSQLRKAGLDV